ncbi:MAG: nucleoside deaminase [Ignavibacteria bacterium]|nr:nucleoside deaminase [Ignavibacteria bacterium]
MTHSDRMKIALNEAYRAYDNNEIPVGCVIFYQNRIIAKTYNQVETLKDTTAHSEILAITAASENIGTKFLNGCSMYVTLEPCPMCAGAIILSRVENLYFGAYDNKSGACGSVINITNNKNLNYRCKTYGGILDTECSEILQAYFKMKRIGDYFTAKKISRKK